MAKLTKAQLIAKYPNLGLKMSMTHLQFDQIIKDSIKPDDPAKKTKAKGEW